jgi:hypothetical protein
MVGVANQLGIGEAERKEKKEANLPMHSPTYGEQQNGVSDLHTP